MLLTTKTANFDSAVAHQLEMHCSTPLVQLLLTVVRLLRTRGKTNFASVRFCCCFMCVCACARESERTNECFIELGRLPMSERENEQTLYRTRPSAYVKERESVCVCMYACACTHTHTHTHTAPEKKEGTSTKQNLPEFSSQLYLVTMQNKQNQGTKIHWRWLHIVTKKEREKKEEKKGLNCLSFRTLPSFILSNTESRWREVILHEYTVYKLLS